MQNIDDILNTYVEAFVQVSEIISEKAKGDWSKLSFLIENDDKINQLTDTMVSSLKDFREATSLGKVFTYPQELEGIYDVMERSSAELAPDSSVGFHLEESRDMIEDILDDPEDRRVKALDMLAQLPSYSPDNWIRRKYMIQGIYISPQGTQIPLYLIQRLEEACFSFKYGNFLASIALARATVEMALKERFPIFNNLTFDEIVNKNWFNTKGLKKHDEMRKMAESIRTAGNQIMHVPQDKVIRIYNEFATRSVLQNLKSLIEFLYQ